MIGVYCPKCTSILELSGQRCAPAVLGLWLHLCNFNVKKYFRLLNNLRYNFRMKSLNVDKHVKFLVKAATTRGFEWEMTEYLRMSGIYWSLTALDLLGELDQLPREEMISYVFSCLAENGGFSPAPNHYPTIIYTLSAIQVLVILKALDQLGENKRKVIDFVKSLQNSDGSFIGSPDDDKEETDTRFSFCAIATLKLLDSLDEIDTSKTVDHIKACQNFDGAFGVRVGSESHAGQVFCCVGTLALLQKLEIIDQELLGWWLADRQLPCGGLNGRPMKKEDVCYSWWALSSLVMIKKSAWIDHKKLAEFILSAADDEIGGIADRPGDIPDPFHTLFGIAGLSLLRYNNMLDLDIVSKKPDITLKPIDPILCLPSYLLHEK